jgi:hypothetical protein
VAATNADHLAKVELILEQLDHPQGEVAENRRRAPRVPVRVPLQLVVLGQTSPAPIPIHSRNLSVSGLGFVSRRLFKMNERVAVYLRIQKLPAKVILGRITFSRYVSGGMYEMGAEFLECIADNGHGRIPSHWLVSDMLVRTKAATAKTTARS